MSTTTSLVGNLIFGKTRGQILALLYGAPEESFFVRQIARQIRTSVGTVQRELQLLSEADLIRRSTLGSQVFFRANEQHPLYPELRSLLQKTFGVFSLLSSALEPLARQIKVAFVFGSVAKGEEKASSDIDLMIVGSVSLDKVLDRLGPAEKQLRRPVQPIIYSVQQLKDRRATENHFLRSLENAVKVFVIGDEDDFREAYGDRVVQGRTNVRKGNIGPVQHR